MNAQIEQIGFDRQHAINQAALDVRKFIITTIVSTVLALAAAVGAGVGIGNLIWAHRAPPAPQQIIIQPGAIQVLPAPAAK